MAVMRISSILSPSRELLLTSEVLFKNILAPRIWSGRQIATSGNQHSRWSWKVEWKKSKTVKRVECAWACTNWADDFGCIYFGESVFAIMRTQWAEALLINVIAIRVCVCVWVCATCTQVLVEMGQQCFPPSLSRKGSLQRGQCAAWSGGPH